MYHFTQFGVFIFMYKQIPFLWDQWDEECHTNLTDCQNIYQKIPPERTGLHTHTPTPPGSLLSLKPTSVSSQLLPLFLCKWTFSIRISKPGRCCPHCRSITATTVLRFSGKCPISHCWLHGVASCRSHEEEGRDSLVAQDVLGRGKPRRLTIEKLP